MKMKKVTSAVANKLLKKLNEDLERLYKEEASKFVYTEIEGIEPIIPDYDFDKTREQVVELMRQIRELKHAINVFNTTTVVIEGMTIDEVLVYMAMLTKEKNRLNNMILPVNKELQSGFGIRNNQVEYKVLNYDVNDVRKHYKDLDDELTALQVQLDIVNSTVEFEIE